MLLPLVCMFLYGDQWMSVTIIRRIWDPFSVKGFPWNFSFSSCPARKSYEVTSSNSYNLIPNFRLIWGWKLLNLFRYTKMMNSQPTTYTIRSHRLTTFRIHMHDWLTLALLLAIMRLLGLLHPLHRFIGKDMMADFKYLVKPSTIPFWSIPVSSSSPSSIHKHNSKVDFSDFMSL